MMKKSFKSCIAKYYYDYKDVDTEFNSIFVWREERMKIQRLIRNSRVSILTIKIGDVESRNSH
jgi:hypothetical protein